MDPLILLVTVLLLTVGLLMVFSASFVRAGYGGDPYYYLKRQAAWAALGLLGMLACSQIQYWQWRRLTRPLLLLLFALLVLVLIPGVGEEAGGARRWLGLGPLSFQPSEFAKLVLVLYWADLLADRPHDVRRFWPLAVPYLGVLGAVFGLIMLQPDLGTAVTLAGTGTLLLFAAGVPLRYLLGLGLAALPAVGLLIWLEPYRWRRIVAFLDPTADPLGAGYHIIQSLYAIGSGGLFGLGYAQSRQKYFYLPEQHTDFIFAVLAEELGFVGAAAVILLFAVYAWRGFRTAVAAPDTYAALLACGLTGAFALQAALNLGVVTSLLPVTGVPLPLISYGGSSLVFTLAGTGILLNISRYAR